MKNDEFKTPLDLAIKTGGGGKSNATCVGARTSRAAGDLQGDDHSSVFVGRKARPVQITLQGLAALLMHVVIINTLDE